MPEPEIDEALPFVVLAMPPAPTVMVTADPATKPVNVPKQVPPAPPPAAPPLAIELLDPPPPPITMYPYTVLVVLFAGVVKVPLAVKTD
jgi:hypothetical protein